jgi:dipeptidyl aminopeptidase/acylaminoacyl peptidase
MFKSIFSKLIIIFILILGIAFSITGVMLDLFLDHYFTDERGDMLEDSANYVNSRSAALSTAWIRPRTLIIHGLRNS